MLCTCSLSFVVAGNDLLKQGLIIKAKHDGSESMFVVIEENTFCISQCGVCLVSSKKLFHKVSNTVRHCTGEPLEAHR